MAQKKEKKTVIREANAVPKEHAKEVVSTSSEVNISPSDSRENIKKRTFILKGINFEEIDTKYGLTITSNIENIPEIQSTNITKIVDVLTNEPEPSVSFYEENSKEYKCLLTMDGKQLLSQENMCCFWCKHPFKTLPIGCPVKYVNKMIEKSYISQITKGEYSMRENITSKRINKLFTNSKGSNCTIGSTNDITLVNKQIVSSGTLQKKGVIKDSQGTSEYIPEELQIPRGTSEYIKDDFFITDGIFCSFNCVLAFIHDNKTNVLYKESLSLLNVLYKYLISKDMTKIIAAPHWRLLKNYGGCLSIEEFRNSFNRIKFEFIFTTSTDEVNNTNTHIRGVHVANAVPYPTKGQANMQPLSFVYKKS